VAWANAIANYKKYNKIKHGNTIKEDNSWKVFFDLTDRLIAQNKDRSE